MLRRVVFAVMVLACLSWVGCGGGGGGSSSSSGGGQASRPAQVSRPAGSAPSASARSTGSALFRLPMPDGQAVTVRTPAALFFFTSWCGYCKQAMPEIKQLADMGRSRGWRVYGIDVQEGPAEANAIIQQYQPNFPVLLDQQGAVAREYGVNGYPTFVLIDENNNIIYNSHQVPRGFSR